MPDLMLITMQQCTNTSGAFIIGKYEVEVYLDTPHFNKCTCPSYTYSKPPKHCKHIQEAQQNFICGWHQMFGIGQTEEQKKDMICPECGESTEYVKVGV